jgi:hypothetical protein
MDKLELDHLGFACRDLGALLRVFEVLGFAATPPQPLMTVDEQGEARPLGQTSAHLVFGRTYIELSAVPDPAAGNHLEPFLARYEGLHIIAFRGGDLESRRLSLARAGLSPTTTAHARRGIGYGELHGEAHFHWFMLPAAQSPEGLVCVVDNQSPDLVYQPSVQSHPNGALDLCGLILCVDDLAAAMRRWQGLLGPAAQDGEGSAIFALGNATLRLVRPAVLVDGCPPYAPPAVPCIAGLDVRVRDPGALRARAERAGWAHEQRDPATLSVVVPGPAHVLVTFRAACA